MIRFSVCLGIGLALAPVGLLIQLVILAVRR